MFLTGLVSGQVADVGVDIGGGVIDTVSGWFKKPEPNAGTSSFIDAIDNYEAISTTKARSIVNDFTQLIASGATDRELASYLAQQAGEPGRAEAYYTSWKWGIVSDWVNKTRRIIQEQNQNAVRSSAQSNVQSSASGFDFNTLLPVLLIGGAVFFFNK